MTESRKRICLILPSLTAGGMERVMTVFAEFLAAKDDVEVHLVLLSKKPHFFSVPATVTIHEPAPRKGTLSRLLVTFSTIQYLRKKLKALQPHALLSFGSMFNSFVMIASRGLGIKTYLSDRSNPYRNTRLRFKKDPVERHDGPVHFFLKRFLYKRATGLVVQTEAARKIEEKFLQHKNIVKFPNPLRLKAPAEELPRKNYILNVGRFIGTKQQQLLLEIFAKVDNKGWELVFAGDGPRLAAVQQRAVELGLQQRVHFPGNVADIDRYYFQSEIFAFTSITEGFPNALGEALMVPLAVIAFDCVAGPSDLIGDDYNGYLVPVNDIEQYCRKLGQLMEDAALRERFKQNAREKMKTFDAEQIMTRLYEVLKS